MRLKRREETGREKRENWKIEERREKTRKNCKLLPHSQ